MQGDLARLVRRALDCIAAEQPGWARRLDDAALPYVSFVEAGASPFAIVREAGRACVVAPAVIDGLRVELAKGAVANLVFGRTSVMTALADESLAVFGRATELARLEDFFHLFLLALARTTGIDNIADDWSPR